MEGEYFSRRHSLSLASRFGTNTEHGFGGFSVVVTVQVCFLHFDLASKLGQGFDEYFIQFACRIPNDFVDFFGLPSW